MAINRKLIDEQLKISKEKKVHRIKVLKRFTIVEALALMILAALAISQANWAVLALTIVLLSKVYQNWLTQRLVIMQQRLLDDFVMISRQIEEAAAKKGKK